MTDAGEKKRETRLLNPQTHPICAIVDRLGQYSRKSDCFHIAATAIRVRCGELHMAEAERVEGKSPSRTTLVDSLLMILYSGNFDDTVRDRNR